MSNDPAIEQVVDPMVALQKRAAGGDPAAAREIAALQKAHDQAVTRQGALEAVARGEQLLREARQGSDRKTRTGLMTVSSSSDEKFYTRAAGVCNFVEDHDGDIVSISYSLRNSSVHFALIHFTVGTPIYEVALRKVRALATAG